MDEDLEWAVSDDLIVHDTEMQLRDCNWKLLLEGGLEAYHFRVAHRKTIARLFNDNLSSYVCHGPHIRSILPRATLSELREQAQSEWNIREQANVLYTLFPNSSLLVQSDHVIWVKSEPLSVNQTEVRVVTLKPRNSEASKSYWDKNHGLTVMTLNEDFDLAESIQSGMASGANDYLRFGRFEGALRRFNDFVSDYLRE
ncbi:MAG: SRPBCC family protein [Pseudomonadota bacterium]